MISYLANFIRLITGIILMLIALRAFLRTRTTSMFYLTIGFSLLTLGDMFSAIFYANDLYLDNLFSDIFDILGMIFLIIAIKES